MTTLNEFVTLNVFVTLNKFRTLRNPGGTNMALLQGATHYLSTIAGQET